MLWFLLFVVVAVVAYKYRVKLLAKILGQPESRIERQIERTQALTGGRPARGCGWRTSWCRARPVGFSGA